MDAKRILEKYLDILRQIMPQDFTEEQLGEPMLDLGINSFTVVEIMVRLEQAFNVDFPDSRITPGLFASPQTIYEELIALMSTNEEI